MYIWGVCSVLFFLLLLIGNFFSICRKMSGKDQDYRIFVGGLAWDVTDRQLEGAFDRYGKILDCQVRSFQKIQFSL